MGKVKDYDVLRSRGWTLVLYSDSDSYNFDDVIQLVRSYPDYAFIKHDSDVEEKKSHYHVNIYFQNACSRSAVLKKLGLPSDYTKCESIDFVRSMNRYLTHIDYPERVQYSLDLVTVSSHYQKKFKQCYNDLESEEDIINKIYFRIDSLCSENLDYYHVQRELLIWCSSNCYENVFKKYMHVFLDYLKNIL